MVKVVNSNLRYKPNRIAVAPLIYYLCDEKLQVNLSDYEFIKNIDSMS